MTCQPCVVPEHLRRSMIKITPFRIMKAACMVYDVTIKELQGRTRKQEVVDARHMAMYVIRRNTGLPYKDIGDAFKRKDHTTAIHACKKIMNERGTRGNIDLQTWYKEKYRQVMELLK